MKKISSVQIPKAVDLSTLSEPMTKDAIEVENYVGDLVVKTNDDLYMSTKFLSEIKSQSKEIDEKRKSFTDPLKKVIQDVDSFFKPAIDSLKEAEKIVKAKIARCVEERLDDRDEILEKVEKEKDRNIREAILDKADKLLPPKIAGLSFREPWVGELTAPSKVIRWAIDNNKLELLQVNEKALKNFTNAIEEDPKIPGWEVYKDRTVVITPSKVK